MSYFLSACGITEDHEDKCVDNFEDDFGNFTCEENNMPFLCHSLCEVSPTKD